MSTMEHTSAPSDVTVTVVVSTAPVLTRLLPGRIPHVSFHLETPEAPGVNVHVDGSLAELAHLTIHRHDKVSVVVKRIYRANPHQITPDVDAEAFDLESRPRPKTDDVRPSGDEANTGQCTPDDDPEFCATHEDGMFKVDEMICDEAPLIPTRSKR